MSHLLKGQLYGPNRDQKLFKNSDMVKIPFKNSEIRKRDNVTFIKRSTFWPKIHVENTRDSVFFGLFSVSVT